MAPSPSPARPSRARSFWLAFAAVWVLTATWSLASPLASGPDENAHMVKAAAVVRGDLHGHSAPDNPGSGLVDVPGLYTFTLSYPVCFAFHGETPASCAPALPTGDAAQDETEAPTWVIRNNPAYYAVVGLPTLLAPSAWTLYLMRLLSVTLCSLVLAWGFRELLSLRRRAMVTVGAVAATTPMVVYLNSTVNPSGLEISAALTLWVCLLALVRAPDPARIRSRAAGIAVVAVLLANSRGLAPLWLGLIAVTVAAIGPWDQVRAVLVDRRTWPWFGVVALGTVVALSWTLRSDALGAGGADHPELGFLSTAHRTFFDTGDFLLTSIGRFGWLDTPLPMLVYVVYVALIGTPVVLALALGRTRDRVAMVMVVAVAVLVPVVLHAWQARSVGYIWTARYSMPLYVGVPVVAGYLLRDALRSARWIERRLLRTLVPLLAAGQAIAFVVNLRRYAVGSNGSWRHLLSGGWTPPVPALLLLLLQLGVLAASVVALVRLPADEPEPTAREEVRTIAEPEPATP